MALSEKQVGLLAQGLAGSRTNTGLTKVSGTTVAKTPQKTFEPGPGVVSSVLEKAGNVAKFAGNLAVGAVKYVGKEISEIPGEAYRTATRVVPTVLGFGERSKIRELNREIEIQSKSIDTVFNDYKAGRITKEQYKTSLSDLTAGQKDIGTRGEQVIANTDPMKAVEDFTDTALLIATMGLGKAASAGAKPGGSFLGRMLTSKGLQSVTKANLLIEGTLSKIPGNYFTKLFAQEATSGVVEGVAKRTFTEALKEVSAKDATKYVASKMFYKYPLVYHAAFDDITNITQAIIKGDYGSAAVIAALDATALIGGPIKASKDFGDQALTTAGRSTFGTNSLFDELSGRTLGKDRGGIGKFVTGLKETDPQRYDDAMRWMKSIQATNLYATKGDVGVAADSIERWFYHHGVDVSKLTPQEVFESVEKYGKALDVIHQDLRSGIVAGVDPTKFNAVTLGRWDQTTRDAFADQIQKAGTKEQALKLLEGAAEEQVVWTHNDTLNSQVRAIIESIDESTPQVGKTESLTVYRGTGGDTKTAYTKLGDGKYVSTSEDVAKGYGKQVEKYQVAEDAKLLDLSDPKQAKVWSDAHDAAQKLGSDIATNTPAPARRSADISRQLREQGYDGVKQGDEIVVFNESKLTPVAQVGKTPLQREALKYNSADEFVEAQGTTIYHGTSADVDDLKTGSEVGRAEKRNLLYGTEDPKLAAVYGKSRSEMLGGSGNGQVKQLQLSGKILRQGDYDTLEALTKTPEFKQLPGRTQNIVTNISNSKYGEITTEQIDAHPELAKFFSDQGITGVEASHPHYEGFNKPKQIVVTDPTAIKTKEELTKLYNQAFTPKTGNALKKAAAEIKAIDAQQFVGKGWSKAARQAMNEGGYIPIIPKRSLKKYIEPERAGQLVSDYIDGADQTFKPLPGIDFAGGILKKVGLNPQDTTVQVNQMLRDNLESALDGITLPRQIDKTKGAWVVDRLSNYMESLPQFGGKRLPAQDARTLTRGEIATALGVTKATAKEVQHAILGSYLSIPMSMRGLGDKLVDAAYAINPLQRTYSRIQGAFRYAWNPFFRLQEMAETEILSQALTGGKVPQGFGINGVMSLLFKKTGQQIDDAVKLLDKNGVFSGTLGGEAAQDVVIGRITANLTKTQKKSLAGMALKLADAKGIPLEQMMLEGKDEIADALRVIVQYPSKSPLNSPLARTLNLAFFPARYNLKIAGLAAKSLAQTPPAVQIAVVNGLIDAREWLQSDEGIRWQSEYQDAIRIFKWITPYNSLESVMNLLNGNKPESIGEFGQLGGLPFGLITQMIDSQTDKEVNKPYIDLKTGAVFPEYIPQTTKARAAQAMQDFIGSIFTYPGRTLGLPGKTQILRDGTNQLAEALGSPIENSEYTIKMPDDQDLTKTQKNQLRVLEEAGIRDTEPKTYNYVFDGYSWNSNGYYIPVDIVKKAKETTPNQAPERLRVPTKSEVKKAKASSKTPASERVARPIEKR